MKPICSTRHRSGFTLVEIALSLAIIGFALVAIIGVLPFGLNVQKENREETVVVQDANFFLDAIRTGARGLDDLTNYVDSITNYQTVYRVENGDTNLFDGPYVFAYTYTQAWVRGNPTPANVITNGARIVGLLSRPKFEFTFPAANAPIPSQITSNFVVAYVRSLSGPAIDKSPQTNAIIRDLAFRYRLVCEMVPFDNVNQGWVNFAAPGLTDPQEINIRSNAWRIARNKQANLHELRLLFRWPIDSRGAAGNQRQVFRALVSGQLLPTNHIDLPIWLMQPGTYQAAQ